VAKKRVRAEQGQPLVSDPEVWACVLEDLRSADEEVRASAMRRICPCRAGFELPYEQIAFALRKDPSAKVRHAAAHVLEESYGLMERQIRAERLEKRQELEDRRRPLRAAVGRRPRARGWRRTQLPLRITDAADGDA
jgi:hypothetical protein